MKVAIVAILACVVVAHAANVHVVDWDACIADTRLLRDGMKDSINQIRDLAKADNPIVGGIIGGRLSAVSGMAYAALGRLESAMVDMTLTQDQANLEFNALKDVMAGGEAAIQPMLGQLSAPTQEQIGLIFRASAANIDATAEAVRQRLEAGAEPEPEPQP